MRIVPLRLFALVPALVLAACGGQVSWHKAGSDDASVAVDLTDCRAAAHSAAQRMYGPPQMSVGQVGGPFGGPTAADPTLADRQMREQEAVNRCMRDKGYALVSAGR
jgi:hypothetical protein